MTDNEIIKALKCCGILGTYVCDEECPMLNNEIRIASDCRIKLNHYALTLINRQQAEIKMLKIENQSLRGAANSYKIHYNKAVKDFEEFAQRAYIDNPFACQYCVHSVANGRACLWKEEHEKDGVSCLGKHFKYYSNKMVGDTE